jgi:thymidylate synthase
MVNAWNVGELDQMVLPPCHYGFQVYTRELSDEERLNWMKNNKSNVVLPMRDLNVEFSMDEWFRPYGVPKRAISLMWNQRSCDVPLGIPMNIASYGLLLMMIADEVNMIPEELIGNLGDCHIYLNQMEGVKEQIGREPFELPTVHVRDGIHCSSVNDVILENYQSHSKIYFPLSN